MNASESLTTEQEAQAERSPTESSPQAPVEPNDLTTLGELLAVDEPGADDPSGTDRSPQDKGQSQSGSNEAAKPTRFNDLAGTLDMDLDALYGLEVSLSEGGEAVTVETLKDAYKDKAQNDLDRITFEEQRVATEQAIARERRELQEILSALPQKAVRPEVLNAIRQKHDKTVAVERQKTLDVIPEWRDEQSRAKDAAGMAEHLTGYGFPPDYLNNVVNHQQLKYIRDNWLREQRMQKALAAVRSGKPGKKAALKPQAKAPQKNPATPSRSSGHDKLADIFSTVD